jgi:hypothetical protein
LTESAATGCRDDPCEGRDGELLEDLFDLEGLGEGAVGPLEGADVGLIGLEWEAQNVTPGDFALVEGLDLGLLVIQGRGDCQSEGLDFWRGRLRRTAIVMRQS